MTNYVLAFRGHPDRTNTADQDAAWMSWFQQLGSAIVDPGNRTGRTSTLGKSDGSASVLTGYTVITADDLTAAVDLAKGCPGLSTGGGVEIAEIVPMS